MIRKSKANYNRCLFKRSMKNPKDFWTNIKKMFPTKEKSENAKVFKIDDTPTTDKQTITNAFCTYFTCVGFIAEKYHIHRSYQLDLESLFLC